ncbi:MAG: geranylgeranylglyceryl/heptaprenylglyceryl phosphate synthase [Euryarchaeota archaeon]|nr:geranylgeranylglyceryl/heptaprenylglyceryl phosphate synthase [Euryarchaeota archaeon]
MLPEEGLLNYFLDQSFGCRHITLIDPGKQSAEIATRRAIAAIESGSSMIFVGGSTDTPDEVVHETCKSIQEALELQIFAASQDPLSDENKWRIPVVLFPGGAHALSPAADGITFMMLMNSKSRRFLIGEQLRGAPHLEKFGVEPIPTGYIVFSPGGKVGEVGDAELIKGGEEDTVYAYALTAKMFGFKALYLEAGSGASTQVDVSSIESARQVEELCLVVGGGIRSGEQAARAANAGANWVVTGTLTEDATSMEELKQRVSEIVSAIQSSSS